ERLPMSMTDKATTATEKWTDKLPGLRARRARIEEEIAEAEKRAAWEAGEEHRARIATLAAEALGRAAGAAEATSTIRAALDAVTTATSKVHELVTEYNGA